MEEPFDDAVYFARSVQYLIQDAGGRQVDKDSAESHGKE